MMHRCMCCGRATTHSAYPRTRWVTFETISRNRAALWSVAFIFSVMVLLLILISIAGGRWEREGPLRRHGVVNTTHTHSEPFCNESSRLDGDDPFGRFGFVSDYVLSVPRVEPSSSRGGIGRGGALRGFQSRRYFWSVRGSGRAEPLRAKFRVGEKSHVVGPTLRNESEIEPSLDWTFVSKTKVGEQKNLPWRFFDVNGDMDLAIYSSVGSRSRVEGQSSPIRDVLGCENVRRFKLERQFGRVGSAASLGDKKRQRGDYRYATD